MIATPSFLYADGTQTLSLTGPNERQEAMTGFSAEVPDGLRIVRALPTDGWESTVAGSTATWSGGRLATLAEETFELELDASVDPGPVQLVVAQLYPGGQAVRWPVPLTVVPGGPEGGGESSLASASLIVVGAIGIALFGVIAWAGLRRRGSPRDVRGRASSRRRR